MCRVVPVTTVARIFWLGLFALVWQAPMFVLGESPPDKVAGPAVQLKAALGANSLKIDVTLRNGSQSILVYDRMIRYRNGTAERDPEQVLRFVHGSTLRLLLGAAPEPDRPVSFGFIPHATKLAPHAKLRRSLTVPLPASEYSAWLPDAPKLSEVPIDEIVLFVEYVTTHGVRVAPSRLFPGAFDVIAGESSAPIQRVRSNVVPLSLRALRVDGPAFPRLHIEAESSSR
jgi:hypothetical protein